MEIINSNPLEIDIILEKAIRAARAREAARKARESERKKMHLKAWHCPENWLIVLLKTPQKERSIL